MKLTEKVSWLIGRLQRSLLPSLEQCCVSPLSQQEKHLVKIIETIEIERHIPRSQAVDGPTGGGTACDRSQLCGQGSLWLSAYQESDQELRDRPNLRLICGFPKHQDVPSESIFSRAFAEFAKHGLGTVVHNALVQDYLQDELIGHVSRDSTAIIDQI